MKKLSQTCENLIHYVILVIFSIFAFFTIFHFPIYAILFKPNPIKIVISCIIVIGGLYIFEHGLEKACARISKKAWFFIKMVFFATAFLVQVLYFLKVVTPNGWDVLEVLNSAEFGLYNGDYYVKHSNNLFLQRVMTHYINLVKPIPFLSSLRKFELLNIVCTDMALIMTYLTARKAFGVKAANRVGYLEFVLIAYHPMLSVVYSDTLGMMFPIGVLLFTIYGLHSEEVKKKSIFFSLAAIMAVIGIRVKPMVVILVIAIAIVAVLHIIRGGNGINSATKHNGVVRVLPIIIAVIVAVASYEGIHLAEKPLQDSLKAQYPDLVDRGLLHYIGVGLYEEDYGYGHGFGSWNQMSVDFTVEHIGKPDYTKKAIENIGELIKGHGFPGYPVFLFRKLVWAGSDGTFYYGGEGDFHLEEIENQNTLRGKLQNYIYTESDLYTNWIGSWFNGVWLAVCLLVIISCVSDIRNYHPKEDNDALSTEYKYSRFLLSTARLMVIGLLMFLLIFEDRSRYLFMFLPMIMLCMCSASGNQNEIKESNA